jgi:hypothetical protein
MRRPLPLALPVTLLTVVTAASLAAAGCKKPPIARIEALRDALARGDGARVETALEDLPACNGAIPIGKDGGCLGDLARAFGAKAGYRDAPPDQASAAAVAVVITREGHGEWLASPAAPNAWLGSMRTGGGPGPDALRLAVATAMADAATRIGHAYDDDASALALLKNVSAAVPGACVAYALLGAGADPTNLAPELTADHSPCVQKDLERKEGPGGTYGHDAFRAAEGALALWKDAASALREGAPRMEGRARKTVDAHVATIDAATAKVVLKKLPPPPDSSQFMSDVHGDAGVPIVDGGTRR